MTSIKLQEIESVTNIRGIEAKTIVHHDHITMKNLILKPLEAIPSHQVPVDVTFFFLKGQGTITIGDETVSVGPEDIVLCPPNTPMSLTASDQGLSFLNIKTPGIIVMK